MSSGDTQNYKGQVDIRTESGVKITVQASGTGRPGETPDQIMGGLKQAAEQQYPNATVEAVRYRRT
ncbi:hypothetical protein Kpho02_76190 [Kitasatospora phosalacinea]|uniref:Uncharacterized protein n=1 Tax=Kitasatospora phosalacinea TaxID=2065 RepID=A0A9W6QEI8_9ACTN|nr:hypothetical protein [Kitasatospora phosalacinea]GLW75322.1 hypothetical protein Kpho02_76190 [Kitasatospora phosalacinea]